VKNALGLAPLVIAIVGFEVYCLVEVVRRPVRTLPRWIWAVICLASIPVGGVLYLLLGRGEPDMDPADPEEPADPASAPDRPVSDLRQSPATAAPPADRDRDPDRSGPPALTTSGLSKRYGGHAALDDVSISVPAGSVFGLVGPNGAGKTTLLALLAGLRHPTSGRVSFGVPTGKVALLPDTPHFEPWLTAWEVVDLARRLALPDSEAHRTTDALARAGLADAAHRRTGGFSRGMLQRLGLAATIVGEPELLLLDEPCSALDPLGRREMLDLVGRLGGDHTVLFCSHILDDVQEVCDTVAVLHHGRLLFEGELNDLLVGHAAPAYTVRVRPPAGPVVEALRTAGWVRAVEQVGAEEIHLRVESLADAEHHLVELLARAGAVVVSVVPAGTDLEHVFLELVR
jgi:ABC-2 type transport system ATP-binding protein